MSSPKESRERAILIAAETMGELVAFWGFKASMGRIWTLLYLSPRPLPADEIATLTGLSTGAVSMALSELLQWGIIDREPVLHERKRHFRAETDVWGIVRRIMRERELRLVGRARQRFGTALRLLQEANEAEADEDIQFMIQRLQRLHDLAGIGYNLVETFAEVGRMSLEPIRGALSMVRRP